MSRDYECPVCDEWISVTLDSENIDTNDLKCPWCKTRLRLDADAEFENGSWRDLSKLVTFGSHWDEKDVAIDALEEMEHWEQGNPEGETP